MQIRLAPLAALAVLALCAHPSRSAAQDWGKPEKAQLKDERRVEKAEARALKADKGEAKLEKMDTQFEKSERRREKAALKLEKEDRGPKVPRMYKTSKSWKRSSWPDQASPSPDA